MLRSLLMEAGFGSYSDTWMCRTILLPELAAVGASLVTYPMTSTLVPQEWLEAQKLSEFIRHFPDQGAHLKKYQDLGIKDIDSLRRHLKWEHIDVCEVTMWLCLFHDGHLVGPNVDWGHWLGQDFDQ